MIPAEREQLIEALLSGTLDEEGEQALRGLAQQDREIQELMRQQDLLKQGMVADRSMLVQAGTSPILRDQVLALSKATGVVSSVGAGATVVSLVKWGVGLVATFTVAGVVYFSSLEDAEPADHQPTPAVTIERERLEPESASPVVSSQQPASQSSTFDELERSERAQSTKSRSYSVEQPAETTAITLENKLENVEKSRNSQRPLEVRAEDIEGKLKIDLPERK